jgi:hypothetical protein
MAIASQKESKRVRRKRMEGVLSEKIGESAVIDGKLQLRTQDAGSALGQPDVTEHVIGELLLTRSGQGGEDGLEERDDAHGGRSCWKREKSPQDWEHGEEVAAFQGEIVFAGAIRPNTRYALGSFLRRLCCVF